jgi:integrase/recombinase XerD
MKVSAALKGQPDAHNRYAIYIRVNDGKHRSTRATNYRVRKEQFEKGRVVNHAQAEMINNALRVLIAKKEIGESKTYKDADFASYVQKHIDEHEKIFSYETIRQYKGEVSKLQQFRTHIRMSQMDAAFLRSYATYCRNLGNMESTVWKTFKFLRMIIRKALKEKVISENPFDTFKMPRYEDPKKNYLTREQLGIIEHNLDQLHDLRFTATWFLICCYTGLRFGDATKFDKKKNIKSGRIVVHTSKTGEVISMPLSDKLRTLFESIQYKPYTKFNNHANAELRGILSACWIDERITWHESRHTFAVMCASLGISQEVTAKLLGHRSLRTTSIYYRITNPRIDAEVGRLFC